MTKHPVHNSRTTNPSSRLLPRALIAGGLLVAALISATFVTPQSGLAHKASVDSSPSEAVAAVEPMKFAGACRLRTAENTASSP